MEQYVDRDSGGRVPPSHLESEKSVLGAMMRSRDAALATLETLSPEDFYDPANREIFSAMAQISASFAAIDLTTLDAELTRRGKLEAVGGAAYLVQLSRSVPSAANIKACGCLGTGLYTGQQLKGLENISLTEHGGNGFDLLDGNIHGTHL